MLSQNTFENFLKEKKTDLKITLDAFFSIIFQMCSKIFRVW